MTPSYTKITKRKITRFYLTVHHHGKQLRLSTGISVPFQCVQDNDFLPINTKHVSHVALNEKLRFCKQQLEGIIIAYQNENSQEFPSFKYIKDEYNRVVHNKESVEQEFWSLWKRFIEWQMTGRGERCITGGSAAQYGYLKSNLEAFEKHIAHPLRAKYFNDDGINAFKDYLLGEKVQPITIYYKLAMLKFFLKYCRKEHGVKLEISDVTIEVPRRNKHKIVLSDAEYNALLNLELTGIDNDVRNACILEGEISARLGDLSKIDPNLHVVYRSGAPYLIKETQKVHGKEICLPLTKTAVRILFKEYGGKPTSEWVPRKNMINERIKLICKGIGGSFLTNLEITTGSGKYRQSEIIPRWKLVSSHCFRRTFINRMQSLGLTDYDISSMTGQTPNTIQQYYLKPNQDRIMNAIRILDGPNPPDIEPQSSETK